MSNKTIVNLISPKLDRTIKVKYFLVDHYLSRGYFSKGHCSPGSFRIGYFIRRQCSTGYFSGEHFIGGYFNLRVLLDDISVC